MCLHRSCGSWELYSNSQGPRVGLLWTPLVNFVYFVNLVNHLRGESCQVPSWGTPAARTHPQTSLTVIRVIPASVKFIKFVSSLSTEPAPGHANFRRKVWTKATNPWAWKPTNPGTGRLNNLWAPPDSALEIPPFLTVENSSLENSVPLRNTLQRLCVFLSQFSAPSWEQSKPLLYLSLHNLNPPNRSLLWDLLSGMTLPPELNQKQGRKWSGAEAPEVLISAVNTHPSPTPSPSTPL